ncbi:MAG: BREX system serine/threonine kinase PglW [Actinomycetota bacterium]
MQVNQSRFPWEREGLAYIREALPPAPPYRAWANVEFIADDGSINEVDCLVVTRTGIYLIELKAWPGRISGNALGWRWTPPDAKVRTVDNPLLGADRKAKKLKSLLVRQNAMRGRPEPWIEPIVFLSHTDLDCQLAPEARGRVFGRGLPPRTRNGVRLPDVADLLKGNVPVAVRADGSPTRPKRAVDRPLSQAIAHALAQAGLRPSQQARRVEDYDLGALLDEDTGWQDWAANHRAMPQVQRRIRIWLAEGTLTKEERDRLVRAAHREFRLLEGVQHPSIVRPLDVREHVAGPALVYDHDPDAVRLDHWLAEHHERLSLDTRLHVIREIGEALAYAHGRGLYHRALSPRSIRISDPDSTTPKVRIADWQTGSRDQEGVLSTGLAGTVHVADLVTSAATAYVAPELFIDPATPPRQLDVFALGAVAFLVLTGRAPAADATELRSLLRDHGALELGSAQDAPAEWLRVMVRDATAADITHRSASVDDFLAALDGALEELTGGGIQPVTEEPVDPLRAGAGDILEGGWRVIRRLGKGATAVALLVEWNGRPEVLKVALDASHHDRFRAEAEILQVTRHKGIVACYGLDEIGGRLVLRLEPAGDRTLAQLLRDEGRLGLDLLARWGDDLLEVVEVLEREGVAHRDIKPDNLGVRPRKPKDELHLVLFDFSLSRTPPEQIRAGTPGYLDPFLEERPAQRWDVHAERWAAAVTLYEIATGTRPRWGEGVDPATVPGLEVTVDRDLFDRAVADGLADFFAVAFRRDPAERFGTADEMRRAWKEALAAADRPVLTVTEHRTDGDSDALTAAVAAATERTALVELGLTPRALDALGRAGLVTVGDLLASSVRDLTRMRGVGDRTRREVAVVARAVRARFDLDPATDPTSDGTDLVDVEAVSVDRLAGLLVPKETTANRTETEALRLLLGLDPVAPVRLEGEVGEELPPWPSQSDVATRVEVSRVRVNQIVARARGRWRRTPALTTVRGELHEALVAAGGLMAASELADLLLVTRGSAAAEPVRTRRARAVVRAALEADQALGEPRWTQRRRAERVVIADDTGSVEGIHLADYGLRLGDVADHLAATDPLPATAAVLDALRKVEPPAGTTPLPDSRLIRLAAACSECAATSSRLDLYPRGMDALRALRFARPALLGQGVLSVEAVHERVRARFPDAAALPGRPELDALLASAETGLAWDHDALGYRVPIAPVGFTTIGPSGTRYSTQTSIPAQPEEGDRIAADFGERLTRSVRDGGFLALTVAPQWVPVAERRLTEAVGAILVSLDQLLIDAMHAQANAAGADWDVVLRADADPPGGGEWQLLQQLVRLVVPDVKSRLLAAGPTVVATDPGLLARYSHLDVLELLRDHCTSRSPQAGAILRTLWVVVPAEDPGALPAISGVAIPVLSPAQWAAIPPEWLDRARRTVSTGGQL